MENFHSVTLRFVREEMGISLNTINNLTAIDPNELESYENGEDNITKTNYNFVPSYESFLTLLGKEKSLDFNIIRDRIHNQRLSKGDVSVKYNETDKLYNVNFTDNIEFGARTFFLRGFTSEERAEGFAEGFAFAK
jgi:hypothetical protein